MLGIDYHHRLSVAEAASFCQKLPSGTLDFLEEPIRDETPDAYKTLRSMTEVPFAIGEEHASKWAFLPYVEQGLTNYARLDICNVGGFTEAMKVAGWCEAHYIDLMPHNPLGPISTAANVHLAAAVPNYSWLEDRSPEFTFSSEMVPGAAPAGRRPLPGADDPRPRRRVRREHRRRAVPLLGGPASPPPRWLLHQLVARILPLARTRTG